MLKIFSFKELLIILFAIDYLPRFHRCLATRPPLTESKRSTSRPPLSAVFRNALLWLIIGCGCSLSSTLPLLPEDPCSPIEHHGHHNIEADIDTENTEIPRIITEIHIQNFQELVRCLQLAELTARCGVWVYQSPTRRVYVWVQEFATSLSTWRIETEELNGGAVNFVSR